MADFKYVKRFKDLQIKDVPMVGGKNASLGEMYRELAAEGVAIPNGFATTADAYRHYIEHNNLHQRISDELEKLDKRDVEALASTGARIRRWIVRGKMPEDLEKEIVAAYGELEKEYGEETDVAIRSSATAEDLPDASFAGQQETYLNIRGHENLIVSCKKVFASLFTNRAISYREDKGFDHMEVALSIGVQKMVRSDKASSGVMFTLDTETGFRDVVLITAAYGLGENVVQGTVNPDEFYVFKPTLKGKLRPVIKRQLGSKLLKMVYGDDPMAGHSTRNVHVRHEERERFCIDDDEVLELARYAVAIENHYTKKHGKPMPMDIEWAKDGITGKLFIVQARPETVESGKQATVLETYRLDQRGEVRVTGKSVGAKIATGKARVILDASHMNELQPGEVLVSDITDPDWEPVMKIASAIVTNRGGRVCHAAIVARELGIPAIVGTGDATHVLRSGEEVTVSCAEGDTGFVYHGILPFKTDRRDLSAMPKPKTKIMLNLANPEIAFDVCKLPNEGVGLARLEFIINNSIRVHPRALLELDKQPAKLRKEIQSIMFGYASPREFYVNRLAEGVGTIAAAFYPKPIIVRMSDFKSNEYAALVGGEAYEPKEENPMIGFRGASRYPSEAFADCFAMECEAIRQVREVMGLDNVSVMIPFARTVDEVLKVMGTMAANGLKRGKNGLKVMLMCEVPTNAVLADKYLEHVDGFSIGSNDLTQLTLGVDRDSGMLTDYDERDEAVLALMAMAIEAAHRHGKYVGICGQAPSDFPEITRWLVEQGIESMSLNPDSVLPMTEVVLATEAELEKKPSKKPATA